uniref:Uncharacterized protein n=1 Tax=Anguilla anguilla TaxID=7936 RepID=A0A0E9RVE2_ANGAN
MCSEFIHFLISRKSLSEISQRLIFSFMSIFIVYCLCNGNKHTIIQPDDF